MTGRFLALTAALVCSVLLVCAGLTAVLFTGGSTAASCTPVPAATSGPLGPPAPTAPSGRFAATGRWGTVQQLTDLVATAGELVTAAHRQPMPLTEAAQPEQTTTRRDLSAEREPDADTTAQTFTRLTGPLTACTITISPQGWTQPLKAEPGSGFRTPDRPRHDGVDLSVARGTPIHAASAGTASRVRCNAVDVRDNSDWGCDRDGHPDLVRGCGWYVDIDHPGGVVTRYCHMLTHPMVDEGQPVAAGQVIGVVGTSGHSSGEHLHYEVHVTTDGTHDHSPASAIDPVWWHVAVGAAVGG